MEKKLRIGVLIDQLVPGGVQKTAIQEAKYFKKMGYKVTLFVLVRLHYKYQYEDLSKGLKVVFLSDFNPWLFKKPMLIPYFSFLTSLHLLNPFFVKRYKVLGDIDFIVSHGTTTCITAAAISRKLKIPYMAFIHDPMIYILEKVYGNTPLRFLFPILKPLTSYYERSFLTSAALIATQSMVHQNFLRNVYYVAPLIIHPGFIPTKESFKKNPKFILGFSRWELAKNPQLFMWLAKKSPKARFLMAGSWTNIEEEKFFREEIKRQKLEDRFKLLGAITEAELKTIASESIVWLHPNFEAFGMAGLEMASLGLPIIIPKGSGVTELFEEGKHGFFPKEGDKKAYLGYLEALLNNPERATLMGEAAAEAVKRCTWERHAELVLKYVERYCLQTKVVCLANAFVSTAAAAGGDQFLIELAKRLPDNFHFTILMPSAGFYHWQKAEVKNPDVRFLVLSSNIFDNKDAPLPLFIAYLIRCVRTYFLLPKLSPFEILHTSTDLMPDVVPAYLFHRQHREISWVARFFHFIETPLKRKGRLWVNIGSYLLQQLSLWLLVSANIVMIDNLHLKRDLVKRSVKEKRIKLHTGGVDTKGIAKVKSNKAFQSDAVFIGRLQPHKGVFDAIEVWKKVVRIKPKAKLVMIGYGTDEIMERLNKEVSKFKLMQNIIFTGFIHDRNTIASYNRSSKMLLFLDHEAGFGLVIAEAMATGLPVVSYNLPIFGSVYKKGFVATDVGNTDAVAKNVIDLLSNSTDWRIISKHAREEAQKFDWSLAGEKFYKEFEAF